MLRRARRHAEKLRLDQVELVEADVESLPLADRGAELFLAAWVSP
jgi:ubiquinone/menaquinone biosynthesis C-methylase UbiE